MSASQLTIATINVNGIRAAAKVRHEHNRGILPWLEETTADVVLLQEVRADEAQTLAALAPALDAGWHLAQAPASAKGRAGVAILSRLPLAEGSIRCGFPDADCEFATSGRYIEAAVEKNGQRVIVASLYLPSGSAGTEKQDEKYRFLDVFGDYLASIPADTPMVIGGDWNICHRQQDLKNWKTNRTKSGFLPDERAFMDWLLGTFPDAQTQLASERNGAGEFAGAVDYTPGAAAQSRTDAGPASEPQWFDVVRRLHPEAEGPYSWWTYRGKAFDTDAGWRIDYQIATAPMCARAEEAWVEKAEAYDLRWSDHSPVLVRYSLDSGA